MRIGLVQSMENRRDNLELRRECSATREWSFAVTGGPTHSSLHGEITATCPKIVIATKLDALRKDRSEVKLQKREEYMSMYSSFSNVSFNSNK